MKALAFDLYGTLLDLGAVERASSKVTKKPNEFAAAWRTKQLEYTYLLALMGRYMTFSDVLARSLDAAASRQGIELKPGERENLLRVWKELPAYEDAITGLPAVTPRVPAVILTNVEAAVAKATLKHAKLDGWFRDVLSADEVRTFKPNPRVYRFAALRLHLDPKDIGLVSSHPFDVMGAKAAGLRTIWVNRAKGTFDPLDLKPDREIVDLTELASQL